MLDCEEEGKVEDARLGYCDKKKAPKTLKSNLAFFEHDLSQKPKGYYRVQKATMKVPDIFNVYLYLHAVKNSKVCYRISNLYGALPAVDLAVVEKDQKPEKSGRSASKLLKPTEHFGKNQDIMIDPMRKEPVWDHQVDTIINGRRSLSLKL